MVRLAVQALRDGHPDALKTVGPLEHLMVDEYQDVNTAQEALIGEMHKRSKTLFVVGDDGQAIYAWRGADVGNIIPFDQRYPNSSSHTLPHNFRSTPTIVESADTFAHQELGPARIPKDPTADAPGTPQDFRNLWFDTRAEEAEWVAALNDRGKPNEGASQYLEQIVEKGITDHEERTRREALFG